MTGQAYEVLASIEDWHWWFVYRRQLIDQTLRQHFGDRKLSQGLELGSGTGGNLKLLSKWCENVVAIERDSRALEKSRTKATPAKLIEGDINAIDNLGSQQFDVIIICHVLYHSAVKNPSHVLSKSSQWLAPGGIIIVTEPAFSFLRRDQDNYSQGARRFRKRDLQTMFEAAGIRHQSSAYFNFLSFFPAFVFSLINRVGLRPQEEFLAGRARGNALLLRWMQLESAVFKVFGGPPVGVSVMGVGAFVPTPQLL